MASTTPTTPTFLFQGWDTQQPKSPKSPKMTLENPLLKNPQLFMAGSSVANVAPSLISEQTPRSPLMPMSLNERPKPSQPSFMATPGPPPKISLSLMGTIPTIQTSSTPARDNKMEPPTPPPVSSPLFYPDTPVNAKFDTIQSGGLSAASSSSGNWVIAYGYRTLQEYQELLELLTGYGKILQQQSSNGKNWFALQYEGRLSAEKALCGQPIRLSTNILCGTVRGSPELLHSLLGGAAAQTMGSSSSYSFVDGSGNDPLLLLKNQEEYGMGTTRSPFAPTTTREEDILNFDFRVQKNTPGHSKSICEKFFAWYFGWSDDFGPTDGPHLHND